MAKDVRTIRKMWVWPPRKVTRIAIMARPRFNCSNWGLHQRNVLKRPAIEIKEFNTAKSRLSIKWDAKPHSPVTRLKTLRGHVIGENFIVAGNYLKGEDVISATAKGFSVAEGELADRLLVGVTARQEAGGEKGGAYSGFLIATRPDQMQPWGPHVDIRIDFARNLISAMTVALAEYRHWEEGGSKDPNRSLDGSEPRSSFLN